MKGFTVMKKIFLFLIIISLMTGCGGEKKSEGVNSMRHDRTIVIGMDEFAPFGFTDESGEIVGFDVDMAKEVAARMGVKAEFKIIDWSNKEYEINSGNVDIIWNGCDINNEYKRFMIFSKPYIQDRQLLLVKKDNPRGIHALGDLAGKIVATQTNSNSDIYLNEDEYLRESFESFETYPTIEEGFASLKDGKYDAIIIDEIAARYEIVRHPDTFETVEAMVGPFTEIGIGFRKGNEDLRDKVQKTFDGMIKDGTAKEISERWFGADLIKASR